MDEKKRLSTKRIILLLLCVAAAALLCCVWIRTDSALFQKGTMSLWNASALINGFASASLWLQSMESERAKLVTTVIAVLAYIWLAFIIYELLQSLWSVLSQKRKLRMGGFVVPAVFAVLSIAAPLLLDTFTAARIAGSLEISGAPYALTAVCVFAMAVNAILDDEPSAVKKRAKASPPAAAEKPISVKDEKPMPAKDERPRKPAEPERKKPAPRPAAPAAPTASAATSRPAVPASSAAPSRPAASETKKPSGGLNVPYRTLGSVRLFPVAMYDVRARLRPIYVSLDRDRSAVQLRLISYSGQSISAVRADIELITAFRESVRLEKLSFTELLERPSRWGREYVSEFLRLDAEKELVRQVHEARVYIRSAVCDGKPCDMPANMSYTVSGVGLNGLEPLRAKYGIDAMEEPVLRDKGWLCCCGRENASGDGRCRICDRRKDDCVRVPQTRRFCSKCGAELSGDMQFCFSCGEPVLAPKSK